MDERVDDLSIIYAPRTANMSEDSSPDFPLVEVGRYARLSQAKERALVVSAMELPHWIVREGRAFTLRVEPPAQVEVARELEKFESEQVQRAVVVEEKPLPKIETLSLYVAAWFLGTCWFLQNVMPPVWEEKGEAISRAIVRDGEWWRALTALVLHGDITHLLANIASGLLFSAFVLPYFGTGATWLLIVLTGFLGNLANAWFYQSTPHISIGSSTAVFGALGLLVATDFMARFASPQTRSRWQLILPLGAGFALLAYLGVGEEKHSQTDYMAHLWGFSAGLFLGTLAALSHLRDRLPPAIQRAFAVLAPSLVIVAWWLALRSIE